MDCTIPDAHFPLVGSTSLAAGNPRGFGTRGALKWATATAPGNFRRL